jgi:hypothetical protein
MGCQPNRLNIFSGDYTTAERLWTNSGLILHLFQGGIFLPRILIILFQCFTIHAFFNPWFPQAKHNTRNGQARLW